MNVRFLETFVTIAQLRSFSATAARLNTTQAAISNRIATLERDLNTQLFERSKREITLTPSGKQLLDRACSIVRLAGEIKSIVNAELSTGSLSIGVTEAVVQLWFPGFLRRFQAAHPDVAVELVVDGIPSLARRLQQGEIDLAFTIDSISEPNLANTGLGHLDCCWFASTLSELPPGRVQLEHLARLGIVTFAPSSAQSASLWHILAKHRIDRSSVRVIHCDSVGAIVALVRAGLGVACLPEVFFAGGPVRRIALGEVLAPLHVQAVVPAARSHPLAREAVAMASAAAAGDRGHPPAQGPRTGRTPLALQKETMGANAALFG